MSIPYTQWLKVSLPTRIKLAEIFGFPKVRSTSVVSDVGGDIVADDGYNVHDMERQINVPAMQAYLNSSETDLMILFKNTIDKAEGREYVAIPPANVMLEIPPEEPIEETPKKIVKKTTKTKKKK